MRNFRNYSVWSEAIELTNQLYDISNKFPEFEKFGLRSQIQRSMVSISANIAEGASRTTEKDFLRFIEIALGSAFETESLLVIAYNRSYVKSETYDLFVKDLHKLQRQLNAFRNKLKSVNS